MTRALAWARLAGLAGSGGLARAAEDCYAGRIHILAGRASPPPVTAVVSQDPITGGGAAGPGAGRPLERARGRQRHDRIPRTAAAITAGHCGAMG